MKNKKDKVIDNQEREVLQPLDLIDVLFDPNNCDPITLMDEDGKQMVFKQVAVVPYDGSIYCVLKPLTKLDGIADDEAIVFRLEEDETGAGLKVEEDEPTVLAVFEAYYELLEASLKKKP